MAVYQSEMCRHPQREQPSVTTSSCKFTRPVTNSQQIGEILLQMPLNIKNAIISSLWQQKVYVSCVLHVLWYSWFYRQEIPSCKNLQPTSLATFFLWWLRLAQNGSKWTPSVFCGDKIFVTVQNRSFIQILMEPLTITMNVPGDRLKTTKHIGRLGANHRSVLTSRHLGSHWKRSRLCRLQQQHPL